jgi:hypothetical protein
MWLLFLAHVPGSGVQIACYDLELKVNTSLGRLLGETRPLCLYSHSIRVCRWQMVS